MTENEKSIVTSSLAKQAKKIRGGTYPFNKQEVREWDDLIELKYI